MAVGVLIPPLAPLVLCAAGFFAARMYAHRLAEPLSTASGARLGWMTGLWLFIVFAIAFAFISLVVSNPESWEQLKATSAALPQTSKLFTLSQHDFVLQLLYSLPLLFFFLTLLPGLGGMLGAKMSARRRPS